MSEILTTIGNWIVWIVSLATALITLWKWIAKPIRDVQANTDMLMGDRLAQAHDYWMRKKYCPPLDRKRLIDMHKAYAERGLNHLAENYEEDILELPEEPPDREMGAKKW
ncbi:MAG: hypothetical protein RR482_02310 [Clostridia bacterium]